MILSQPYYSIEGMDISISGYPDEQEMNIWIIIDAHFLTSNFAGVAAATQNPEVDYLSSDLRYHRRWWKSFNWS